MKEFILSRTGLPPLKFAGEKIVHVDGSRADGREQNRWHDLTTYRTAGGRYVLEITYRSRWQGESDRIEVHHALEPGDLIAALSAHDPLASFVGYPPGAAYEEKQRREEASIVRRFQAGVTELYAGLPAEWFAEEIA